MLSYPPDGLVHSDGDDGADRPPVEPGASVEEGQLEDDLHRGDDGPGPLDQLTGSCRRAARGEDVVHDEGPGAG